MAEHNFKVWCGDSNGGDFVDYKVNVDEGMVVLDVIHRIQAEQANDMAVRWNCKAGKCGSCSVENNDLHNKFIWFDTHFI
jgi:succinate dehydrogenase iron-sulfur subunit